MSGLINYVSCGILWLGLLVKSPDLRRHRHDPYLRAICVVLGLAGLCFFLGAPPTVAYVNGVSGVPNLAAPLTYASITVYSAAAQVLIVYWRGGPHVHRVARRWVVAYALIVLGIATMFALGDAPVERRTDLDTYYATTPFIAEMIVLYLVGHLAATTVTTVSSLRWARQVGGWLRASLLTLGIGTLCNAGYSVSKLVAVIARWCGTDWPVLGSQVPPAAAGLGAVLTVVGVLLPLIGPRLSAWRRSRRTYVRLAPLERELDDLLTRRALRLPRPRWSSPTTRLVWRQTSIHNGLSHLDAYFDHALYERTREEVLRTTADADRAEATAWATVIVTAIAEEPERVDAGTAEAWTAPVGLGRGVVLGDEDDLVERVLPRPRDGGPGGRVGAEVAGTAGRTEAGAADGPPGPAGASGAGAGAESPGQVSPSVRDDGLTRRTGAGTVGNASGQAGATGSGTGAPRRVLPGATDDGLARRTGAGTAGGPPGRAGATGSGTGSPRRVLPGATDDGLARRTGAGTVRNASGQAGTSRSDTGAPRRVLPGATDDGLARRTVAGTAGGSLGRAAASDVPAGAGAPGRVPEVEVLVRIADVLAEGTVVAGVRVPTGAA